ncbi:MAG: PIN domain-containing protein [Pseudomonadota bacterium]
MIHLDTNLLVALPVLAREKHPLTQRISKGEPAAVSSLVWFEYMCGPLTEAEQPLVRAVIGGRIVGLDDMIAERAAVLFNAVGRKRSLRTDSLIAATAILEGAELATFNADDFTPFVAHGLGLIPM